MKTTYLVWKDRSCNGINPAWQEITGQEFLALVRSPESNERYFVKLFSESTDGRDGCFVMESTKTEYLKWKKEKRHREYLRDSNPGYTQISYHALESNDSYYGEELLRDENCDVEAKCFAKFEVEAIRTAIAKLDDDERQIIEYFYLSENRGTVRGYEKLTGIPKSTVNRRRVAVLLKLKKFLEE